MSNPRSVHGCDSDDRQHANSAISWGTAGLCPTPDERVQTASLLSVRRAAGVNMSVDGCRERVSVERRDARHTRQRGTHLEAGPALGTPTLNICSRLRSAPGDVLARLGGAAPRNGVLAVIDIVPAVLLIVPRSRGHRAGQPQSSKERRSEGRQEDDVPSPPNPPLLIPLARAQTTTLTTAYLRASTPHLRTRPVLITPEFCMETTSERGPPVARARRA
ncbi:hypothetical protein CERSUDRAFT_100999 [Gelatoporia subvermispora B]|uniref:Uncharacterized protein n=1 Tax=Ceriporiopsis subvermispora (strain B) TaxID=914234 RepID=M2Q1T4_CERS8|nr:hypothetical protein CERSUDRAFT_100999 [Gelatoporia subvermispora B]